ncbi:MAG: choice-of-anchor J domain-containing protein [Bacteroidetes bacterium]|nr:choice-of-anchor J domain-containing protein [Bacteroidota bacterium]
MKKILQLLTIGILFPVLMHAQFTTLRAGKSSMQQLVPHSLSKNSPPTLFSSSLAGFYREGFEGIAFPPAGWQIIDALNPGYNWEQSYAFPFMGSYSTYIGYGNNPGEDWLILPKFTVAATDSLSFWLAAEFTGFPPDSTFILVSTTDSTLTSFTSVLGTLVEGVNYPTTPFVYQQYSFPLAAFAGTDIYVAIKNKNTFGDGILIDRIDIGTKPALNATPMSIDMNKFIPTSSPLTPSATFQNDGNTVQSFPVIMTITGGYTSTKNVTNLAPGASQQVSFDPWTPPATPGIEIVSVQTQLIGDGYAADDSLSDSIIVMEPFTNYGWSSRAPVSPARMEIPLAAINSNDTSYLFAMGGNTTLNTGGSASNQARIYLPFSNSWNSIATMTSGASAACAASYNNKVYVFGGFNAGGITDNNRIYDVANNTWSFGASLSTPTAGAAFGVYHDSLFYLIGGNNGFIGLSAVQIYNAVSDTWTGGTNLPFAYANMGGGISGNKIVVSDGLQTFLGVIDANDPTIITWTAADDYPAGYSILTSGAASLDAGSGLIVFSGGAPQYAGSYGSVATFCV